jgi:hypothetical protein
LIASVGSVGHSIPLPLQEIKSRRPGRMQLVPVQWGLPVPGNLDLQIDAENHCCACASEEAPTDGDTAPSSMPSVSDFAYD